MSSSHRQKDKGEPETESRGVFGAGRVADLLTVTGDFSCDFNRVLKKI
jgi:hypothetical protein